MVQLACNVKLLHSPILTEPMLDIGGHGSCGVLRELRELRPVATEADTVTVDFETYGL